MPTNASRASDNLRVVAEAHLVERPCALDPVRLAEACDALRSAVDCWPSVGDALAAARGALMRPRQRAESSGEVAGEGLLLVCLDRTFAVPGADPAD
jgi:hypothetical protein